MAYTIFIDGGEGTTGLKIQERFQGREDVTLLKLPEEQRKDPVQRKKMLNQADFVFLCLPDQAAIEAVSLVENPGVRIIDASTAHRCHPDWVYGLPELSPHQAQRIATSSRVAIPGCYPTGFLSLVSPLLQAGVLSPKALLSCTGISGYSGGGKATIAAYQGQPTADLAAPRLYGLGLQHKHLAEMRQISGLEHPPLFTPIIDDFYAGMLVTVPLQAPQLSGSYTPQNIQEILAAHYQGQPMVQVMPCQGEGVLPDGFLPANALAGLDSLELFVFGHHSQILLVARLDNLGKGASGAAVQCMNLMMGLPPETGLNLGQSKR